MNLTEQWIAFSTILSREIKRFMRIWMQTLLPPVITITLYFIIFGSLIGARIGEMGGFSYMEFVVPGLIMMAVITNSYSNVVSSFYGAKFQRFVEELLVSPTPNYIVLWGVVMGGVCRGLLVGLIVTIVATFFADLRVESPLLTITIVLMTSVLFSLAGFINAVFANSFDDISIVPTFVLTPLIYLGGVFYSTELLPEFWAGVSQLNPMLYIVNAFRHGVLGVSDINIELALIIVAGFTVVAYSYAMHLLNSGKRLRQ
ncbi:ABC transporter permease [Dasania sp. GY-MA-18]|uniref:Transport permease protein n=1 Tax=Dasania phycosphaerae TaxID=2950436 RepID=A0A9J6RQH2_9GAMM|nr:MULTISPECIES: ABC transporter permease [Dasania]MCR8924297.1 ABC transporter permease [Dasania sp. GY-MA-18]MCZ0866950.1 ABC transporter permease [Dasania phycosphaerae]MCZ0870454.1 ABC transporter permease [Dasania phycosphaerae]